MISATMTAAQTLHHRQSIFDVPGIGWRTARVLYESGIRTVGQFVGLPELLLRETFGPTLVTIQQKTVQQAHAPFTPLFRSLFHLFAF